MAFRQAMSTVRADLARQEFSATGEGVVWAVVGTGIDGSHPHFAKHANLDLPEPLKHVDFTAPGLDPDLGEREALTDLSGHGTHSAALIAGESPAEVAGREPLRGIAPQCKLLSLKAYSEETASRGERIILQALDHILKANQEAHRIHGVLVSFAIGVNVRNYACGASPVCQAIDALVQSGVTVVVPAGNRGYDDNAKVARSYSIVDPGNAELAVTVGSTHRSHAQLYGASFFSSRGPTVDGRAKPDLLAPGEKIESAWPAAFSSRELPPVNEQDGTLVAAAIVAGGAALLLSAFPALHRRPLDVKSCLMKGAVDLGRYRYAQGAGLLDVLEAMRRAKSLDAASMPSAVATDEARSIEIPESAAAEAISDQGQGTPSLAIPKSRDFDYSIALTFAGAERRFVTDVLYRLRRRMAREHIFFDEYYKPFLGAKNQDLELFDIYRNRSELVVPFLSRAYVEGKYPGCEWEACRDLMMNERARAVFPVRLDDCEVPGMPSIHGFYDARTKFGGLVDPEEIGDMILERLEIERGKK